MPAIRSAAVPVNDDDWERLLEAMERMTGQDRDISVRWWPYPIEGRTLPSVHGQGTQREFLDLVRAEYESLAEG